MYRQIFIGISLILTTTLINQYLISSDKELSYIDYDIDHKTNFLSNLNLTDNKVFLSVSDRNKLHRNLLNKL